MNAFFPYILSWRDGIEILFFSSLLYLILRWLAQDSQKFLLGYAASYTAVLIGTHLLSLPNITIFLLLGTPVALLLLLSIHQQTLQKNFIALRNTYQTHQKKSDWIAHFMRSGLHAVHHNRALTYIIEKQDQLNSVLCSKFIFNIPLEAPILDVICASSNFNSEQPIWLTQSGMIVAINNEYNITVDPIWLAQELHELTAAAQRALTLTHKTDALVVCTNPINRTFTLMVNGKYLPDVSTQQTRALLNKYLIAKPLEQPQGAFKDETYNQNQPST